MEEPNSLPRKRSVGYHVWDYTNAIAAGGLEEDSNRPTRQRRVLQLLKKCSIFDMIEFPPLPTSKLVGKNEIESTPICTCANSSVLGVEMKSDNELS